MPVRVAWPAALLMVLALACSPAGTAGEGEPSDGPTTGIRVGAFNFPESRLLAELYAQALAAAGLPVARVAELGSREIVEPALEQGRIDVVPEYVGSALVFLERTRAAANSRTAETHAALAAAFARRDVTVGAPAPAQNRNAIVVTSRTAEDHALRAISDLRRVAGGFVLGGPPECPQRHGCLRGLRTVYGLRFGRFLSLDRTDHVAAALHAGEIDVGVLFTTDPVLLDDRLVVLDDDRDLQPAENVVPAIRTAVVQRYGEDVVTALDRVSARLTTAELAQLNRTIAQGGTSVEDAASRWLTAQGITP